ncbi:hypothetical protein PsorP6_007852 [Peronosclerospora sorghi]|uniref:Uncharacterized protein n=1 Tax=Peronosclerospora sorghi TaxID=230839 RepID=A0ACC0W9S3_9STRA|nr:hypothetical protein PsorP6_007852 [Peronosclerospora sorghi]
MRSRSASAENPAKTTLCTAPIRKPSHVTFRNGTHNGLIKVTEPVEMLSGQLAPELFRVLERPPVHLFVLLHARNVRSLDQRLNRGILDVIDAITHTVHVSSREFGVERRRGRGYRELARENLDWFHGFDLNVVGTVMKDVVVWFLNGQINASVNCIDRHVKNHRDEVAMF